MNRKRIVAAGTAAEVVVMGIFRVLDWIGLIDWIWMWL